MRKHWWFRIPVIALALYGSSNDFNLSPEWIPFAVGVAILAPFLLLPQLRRLGVVRKESSDYYQLEFRFADGVVGKHSIDEESFKQFEWRGGKTVARIRQSWFGFEVLEIEGSGNPPGGVPKVTL